MKQAEHASGLLLQFNGAMGSHSSNGTNSLLKCSYLYLEVYYYADVFFLDPYHHLLALHSDEEEPLSGSHASMDRPQARPVSRLQGLEALEAFVSCGGGEARPHKSDSVREPGGAGQGQTPLGQFNPLNHRYLCLHKLG